MKNIVNETEKVHDETLQLMSKAQELMNKKMMVELFLIEELLI